MGLHDESLELPVAREEVKEAGRKTLIRQLMYFDAVVDSADVSEPILFADC